MSQTLKVTVVSLAAFAIYLPAAYLVSRDLIPESKPEGAIVERIMRIDSGPGFSFRAETLTMVKYADDSEDNMRSPITVYEDLKPLGPDRSYLRDIEAVGLGRFAFVKFTNDPRGHLLFSTRDNSDPRTNGRKYWAVLPKR